jgi:hypothetical protein
MTEAKVQANFDSDVGRASAENSEKLGFPTMLCR